MRIVAGTAWLLTVVAFASGGDSKGKSLDFDKIAEDIIASFNKTADVLEKVKDKKSAEEARAKLREVAGKLKELSVHDSAFEKLDKSKQDELEKKFKSKIDAAIGRMGKEAVRVSSVEGGKELLRELDVAFGKKGSPKEEKKLEKSKETK